MLSTTWRQFIERCFNSNSKDHYYLLGYYNRLVSGHIYPAQVNSCSGWVSNRQRQIMESPSHHPWLQNMERILRIMKKSFGKAAGFAKAIDFLRFCAAKHYNPWIGRIKEFLALSRSKLIHIEKHFPKLNKVHAQIVRLVRLSKDITISQIKHFIKNSVDDPVQARIDKDDLQYLIDENLIVKKTIYKGPWEQTVYAAAHQSQC